MTYMRFQIVIVNFTNLSFHVQNFHLTSQALLWCGQAKPLKSPAKNWWHYPPSPPWEARAPGLALGNPHDPPFDWSATSPLACLDTVPRRHITEHVLKRLNPLRIDLDPSMSRHANFLSDSQVAQLDFTGEHAFRLPGRYFPSVRAFSRWHASWAF